MTKQAEQILNQIWQLENDIQNERRRFLEASGWTYQTVNPGATWLWQKELNGKLIAVSESTAVDIAQYELALWLEDANRKSETTSGEGDCRRDGAPAICRDGYRASYRW